LDEIPLDRLPLSDGVIRLRLFNQDDASAIADACEDPDVTRWTFMPEHLGIEGARAWIDHGKEGLAAAMNVPLAIETVEPRRLSGQVGIGHLDWINQTGEIYYWLSADARGRGLASRAVRLVTDWAFSDLGLQRAYLFIDPSNEVSQRVAERVGFSREGVLRSHLVLKGQRMDCVAFGRLASDPPGNKLSA
jgi:RimJ/RimL family protein N-acetyltransferase